MKSSNLPSTSFIVPVRDDAVRLAVCLRSIQANALAYGCCDILVADNGSTDGSAELARSYAVHVLVIEHVRVSELRNRAAHHTTGDVLAFVDADNEIGPGWIDAAVETLQGDAVGAVGALYCPPDDGTWVQRAYGHLRGRPRGRHEVDWLGSGNLAVWRSVFEAVGGFDASLEACEDVDLCRRIKSSGFRIVSDARLENTHHGDPDTLWRLFLGELWRGRDNLRVSFRRPITWPSVLTALIPVVDALMIGAAVVGLFVMTRSSRHGLVMIGLAGLVIVGGASLKALRAGVRSGETRVTSLLQLLAVACVYDIARAFALVARKAHRGTGSAAATAP